MDSYLEAFNRNPTDGSFAVFAFQLAAYTKDLNEVCQQQEEQQQQPGGGEQERERERERERQREREGRDRGIEGESG